MRQPWRLRLVSLSSLAAVLIVGGCGGGVRGAKVPGQVLHNGKPIKFLAAEEIMVGFSTDAPAGQQAVVAWASVSSKDGTFTLSGPDGNGIPAGKYSVVVTSQIYQQSNDRFDAVFADKKPPLFVDVGPDAEQHIIIDVGTRTVTKR